MHPTDAMLHAHLSRLHGTLTGLIAIESRAVVMPKPSKMPLAVEMTDDLVPVLADLYWFPFRNGISEAPEEDEDLRAWLQRQLETSAAVAALLALLLRFHRRAVNYGGTIALELLELAGKFNLTNAAYLAMLDERATMLTTGGSEMSLIDTTVNNLAVALPEARRSSDGVLAALGAYIATRALTRSVGIATFEVPWGFAQGLGWTYKENGVKRLMYDVNGVGCPEICAPLHGRTFPIDDVPSELVVPKHSSCDCVHSNADSSWTAPSTVWKGS